MDPLQNLGRAPRPQTGPLTPPPAGPEAPPAEPQEPAAPTIGADPPPAIASGDPYDVEDEPGAGPVKLQWSGGSATGPSSSGRGGRGGA